MVFFKTRIMFNYELIHTLHQLSAYYDSGETAVTELIQLPLNEFLI